MCCAGENCRDFGGENMTKVEVWGIKKVTILKTLLKSWDMNAIMKLYWGKSMRFSTKHSRDGRKKNERSKETLAFCRIGGGYGGFRAAIGGSSV